MKYNKSLIILSLLIWTLLPIGAQDAGTTQGDFKVSQSGAATYTVPIGIPPGVGGTAPGISLQYSSQGGNGLAGWGWNIGGHSSIIRVGASKWYDGFIDQVDFDDKDKFAMDGQRLILKSGVYGKNGSVYETTLHSNIKIIAYGTCPLGPQAGPQKFIAYHPDGSNATYEVKLTDPNNPHPRHANEWVITRFEDAAKNRIYFYYYGSQPYERVRLKSIIYGGNGFQSGGAMNKIEFIWKSRQRPESSYSAGYDLFHRKHI
ncbi:MAG: SpvB/TcaC N-terminal domain-containing protein, partial [Bacteroidota bacterium]